MPTNYFDYIDGFLHPYRASIFSLVFRGFGGEEMVQNVRILPRRSLGSVSDSHACHFPVGLHSGLYRNYFRRCPYCRSSTNGHGSRSHLVGDTYRCESADIFSRHHLVLPYFIFEALLPIRLKLKISTKGHFHSLQSK